MSYSLILLNGGVGIRVGADQPKQLIKINGIPMIVYSLISSLDIVDISEIIINYPKGYKKVIENIVSDYAINKKIIYVEAGKTRQDSVYAMLKHCSNNLVILHESARPLVTKNHFKKLLRLEHQNASLMITVPFTIAPVDSNESKVIGSLDRSKLRNVQLPQKFSLKALKDAHQWASLNNKVYTEDATLCADYGIDVFYIDGDESNIKVTTSNDVRIANFLLGGKENE